MFDFWDLYVPGSRYSSIGILQTIHLTPIERAVINRRNQNILNKIQYCRQGIYVFYVSLPVSITVRSILPKLEVYF